MYTNIGFVQRTCVLFLGAAMAACGGGGSSAPPTAAPPAPSATPVVPVISVANLSVDEGNTATTTATLTVTLSQATTVAVSASYATQNGTATAGSDYQSATGTISFAAGETSKSIVLTIIGNTRFEAEKTFTVTLSSPSNATLGTSTATVTIRNDDERVGSVDVSVDQVVMLAGDRRTIVATVRAANGAVLAGRTVEWTSTTPVTATVTASGEITAMSVGSSTVRASVEGVSRDVAVTVRPPATSYNDYKLHFPYRVANGNFVVASDISTAFSQQHMDHLLRTWQYFQGVFARSPGTYTEMYYTRDLNGLYTRVFQFCPSIVIPGARNLTACFDSTRGVWIWWVVPYIEPDFGTQLHEISHTFLQATAPDAPNWPWFNEGLAMYLESGSFDSNGTYSVVQPIGYLTSEFRRANSAGTLPTLTQLTQFNRDQFYRNADVNACYAYAGFVLYYLHKQHPAVMQELLSRINNRLITNNAAVVNFITAQTGMSLPQLDTTIKAYALSFR